MMYRTCISGFKFQKQELADDKTTLPLKTL